MIPQWSIESTSLLDVVADLLFGWWKIVAADVGLAGKVAHERDPRWYFFTETPPRPAGLHP